MLSHCMCIACNQPGTLYKGESPAYVSRWSAGEELHDAAQYGCILLLAEAGCA